MATTEITVYNLSQPVPLQAICNQLHTAISIALPTATAKLFHGNPVWFMNDNPIVGYDVGTAKVNLLFWSGQSFATPGLAAKGTYKAAGRSYISVNDIDDAMLQRWLAESKHIQWDYKNIRANNGTLDRLNID